MVPLAKLRAPATILDMPAEVMFVMCAHLDPVDIVRLGATCTSLHATSREAPTPIQRVQAATAALDWCTRTSKTVTQCVKSINKTVRPVHGLAGSPYTRANNTLDSVVSRRRAGGGVRGAADSATPARSAAQRYPCALLTQCYTPSHRAQVINHVMQGSHSSVTCTYTVRAEFSVPDVCKVALTIRRSKPHHLIERDLIWRATSLGEPSWTLNMNYMEWRDMHTARRPGKAWVVMMNLPPAAWSASRPGEIADFAAQQMMAVFRVVPGFDAAHLENLTVMASGERLERFSVDGYACLASLLAAGMAMPLPSWRGDLWQAAVRAEWRRRQARARLQALLRRPPRPQQQPSQQQPSHISNTLPDHVSETTAGQSGSEEVDSPCSDDDVSWVPSSDSDASSSDLDASSSDSDSDAFS